MSELVARDTTRERNARWAQASFCQLLNLSPADNSGRAELAAAGVPQHRIDALYPPTSYADLVPGIVEHMRTHPKGIIMWLVIESDQRWGSTLLAPGITSYREGKRSIFSEAQNFHILRDFLFTSSVYVAEEIKAVQSLMWHAWWMMSHRSELMEEQQATADKLMLSTIEYALPGLKVEGQPPFNGI